MLRATTWVVTVSVLAILASCTDHTTRPSAGSTVAQRPDTSSVTRLSDSVKTPTDTTRSPRADTLSITAPEDGASVPEKPLVRGIVADAAANVWVVVHPMEVPDYWVQPRVTVSGDGRWTVQVHIGRPGTEDVGRYFEVMAVAQLDEGKVLPDWPGAQWKSRVLLWTRR